MKKSTRTIAPLAAAAAMAVALAPTAAFADHANGTYQTPLNPINDSGGSGMAMVTVEGDQATVKVSWSGLAETFMDGPYPHVQHIHIGAEGTCPPPSADTNGDGIVDTPEGQPFYGEIGTTLSTEGDTSPAAGTNIKIAPSGSSTDYERTFTLDEPTLDALANGTGVVVVHGLNPANLSEEAANAKSSLVPELPLAATAPALCGAFTSSPTGGVATGAGDTGGIEQAGLLALGGGLLAAAGAGAIMHRRRATEVV
ncbi:CHRD domain-containing protein [Nocardioides sp. SYSU DS0663]|uniref:CHRD domain-containing protein n=1 Tax=Nocardioides sp. SYSU DS0663 TaxID=3416445 RepID=UPI003F4C5F69